MVVYLEHPRESMIKLNYEYIKGKKTLFIIVTQKMKYLGINLKRNVQNL